AISTLYRAYQEAVVNTSLLAERLADRDLLDGGQTMSAPLEEVRDFINSRNNHFPALDETAEELYRNAQLGADEPYVSLRNYLRAVHGVTTRVVPADLMSGELRRYDRH